MGGEATKRKGVKYFRELGRKSGEARRLKAKMVYLSDMLEIPMSDIKKWEEKYIELEYAKLMETRNI